MTSFFQGKSIDADTARALRAGSGFGLVPTGAVAETFPRLGAVLSAQTLTTANAAFTALPVIAGDLISNLTFYSVAAGATLTHQLAGVYSSDLKLLATSTDKTAAAWAATAAKTFAMTTAYKVTEDGFLYVCLAVAATTVPTIAGCTTAAIVADLDPPVSFTDSANTISTALEATATDSAGQGALYCLVT